jgi:hypothetical protein
MSGSQNKRWLFWGSPASPPIPSHNNFNSYFVFILPVKRNYRNGIIYLQAIRERRIVHKDDVFQRTVAQNLQIFYQDSL